MWVLIARQPSPEAAYWPGRPMLSLLDAVLWPAAWVFGVSSMAMHPGLIGIGVVILAIVAAAGRCRRALLDNGRYRFTTYRWGVPMVALCACGAVVKAFA